MYRSWAKNSRAHFEFADLGRIEENSWSAPNKSNQDGFAINRILGEELPAPIFEFADLGRIKDADLCVRPIQAPLVGLRIIETQGQTFDVAGWAIDLGRSENV